MTQQRKRLQIPKFLKADESAKPSAFACLTLRSYDEHERMYN